MQTKQQFNYGESSVNPATATRVQDGTKNLFHEQNRHTFAPKLTIFLGLVTIKIILIVNFSKINDQLIVNFSLKNKNTWIGCAVMCTLQVVN